MQTDIFSCPTIIVHGPGAAAQVGTHTAAFGGEHALLVVDPGLRNAESMEVIRSSLSEKGITFDVFDNVEPEPKSRAVDAAAAAVRDDVDVVIAVGGGSTMDLAKGMRIVAECGGSIRDYRGSASLPDAFRIKLICIPSTSGTGSEVSCGGVYTDEDAGLKFPVSGASNAPDVALVDAMVTRSMPKHITAMTGCDTLTHAVESYVSRFATPVTEALSLQAVELVAHSLQYAYAEPDDIGHRDRMARACTMAAMAFNTSRLGMAHGICLPLATRFHIPHGLAVAVMLPYVMAFNAAHLGKKIYSVAHALGVEARGAERQEIVRRSVEALHGIYHFIRIPLRLRELEVDKTQFDEIAALAMQTHQVSANPRPIDSKDDLLELLDRAY